MIRDTALERELTLEAGGLAGCRGAAEQLAMFAEGRAGTGPVLDLHVRDFRRELLEEIADGRNYAIWDWLQALELQADDGGTHALQTLVHLTAAFGVALQIPVRRAGP